MDARFPTDLRAARQIQECLRSRICLSSLPGSPELVAGLDCAFRENGREIVGAVVVMDLRTRRTVVEKTLRSETPFPYVPGLLSFREGPVLYELVQSLRPQPELLMFDGQGIAHPARLGIAAHLGLLLDIPSIGVAKSRLYGKADEPGSVRGSWTSLHDREGELGVLLRTRERVRAVYVSPGHRCSIDDARRVTLDWSLGWRLPHPVHLADRLSRRDLVHSAGVSGKMSQQFP